MANIYWIFTSVVRSVGVYGGIGALNILWIRNMSRAPIEGFDFWLIRLMRTFLLLAKFQRNVIVSQITSGKCAAGSSN